MGWMQGTLGKGSKQKCRLADAPLPADGRQAWKFGPQFTRDRLEKSKRGEDKREDSHTRQANNNFEAAGPARLDEKLKPSHCRRERGLQQAAGRLTEDKSSALKTRCTSSLCGSTGQLPLLAGLRLSRSEPSRSSWGPEDCPATLMPGGCAPQASGLLLTLQLWSHGAVATQVGSGPGRSTHCGHCTQRPLLSCLRSWCLPFRIVAVAHRAPRPRENTRGSFLISFLLRICFLWSWALPDTVLHILDMEFVLRRLQLKLSKAMLDRGV